MSGRLGLDDQQITHHTMGIMAEQAYILYEELGDAGIHGELRDSMVLGWWSFLLGQASVQVPDFAKILKSLIDPDEEP